MKKFIQRVLFFLLPAVVLILASVFVHRRISEDLLATEYRDEIENCAWVNDVPGVKGYILGSSSLRYGVSASLLSAPGANWVNLSMDARDPIVMYLLLKHYTKYKKPQVVLIGLDPWIYAKKYYKNRNAVMYLDLAPCETFRFLPNDHNVAFKKTQEVLLSGIDWPSGETRNVKPSVPKDFGSAKLKRTAVNFNNVSDDWFEISKTGWSDMQFEYLGKVYAFCRSNNIEAIFLVPPKREDYVFWAKGKFGTEHDEWWHRVNERIAGAKILGSFDMLRSYDQDSIFAEAYHLNATGQEIYSRVLKDNLENYQTISPGYDFISATAKGESKLIFNK